MKKIFSIAAAAAAIAFTSCAGGNANADTNEVKDFSYAFGMSMGNNFKQSGIDTLNVDEFAAGLKAMLTGATTRMTEEEAQQVMQNYFTSLQQKMQSQREKLAADNEAEGNDFLAKNKERAGVKITESGLQYEILTEGNGPKPTATDRVKVHYTGKLINGTVFDSSVDRGEPATFGVNQVIPGWTEILQMMPVGSKWRVFIPSALAYGARGAGADIGPNATLIFDIDLLEIIKD